MRQDRFDVVALSRRTTVQIGAPRLQSGQRRIVVDRPGIAPAAQLDEVQLNVVDRQRALRLARVLEKVLEHCNRGLRAFLRRQASRLAKMIVVYLDGRCRWKTEGDPESAECIRGNFYADSLRPEGGQIDAWVLELADHIDQRFRTMGEATIEWPE